MADNNNFEAHKEAILDLYITQKTPLPKVIRLMEARGFHKNKGQYVGQFRAWGITKYKKGSDWRAIHRIKDSRHRQGKDTDVYHRGQLVPRSKVDKAKRHLFLTLIDRLRRSPTPELPEEYSVRTPVNTEDECTECRTCSSTLAFVLSEIATPIIHQPNYAGNRHLPPSIRNFTVRGFRGWPPQSILDEKVEPWLQATFLAANFFPQIVQCDLWLAADESKQLLDLALYFRTGENLKFLEILISNSTPTAKAVTQVLLPAAILASDIRLIGTLLNSDFDSFSFAFDTGMPPHTLSPYPHHSWHLLGCVMDVFPLLMDGSYRRVGPTYLHFAASTGNPLAFQFLLERVLNTRNAAQIAGKTWLPTAVEGNNARLVQFVLETGINAHTTDNTEGLLHLAARTDNAEIAQLLIRHGVNIDAKCRKRGELYGTPLQVATHYKSDNVVQLLLQHCADANAPATRWLDTPLQEASRHGNIALVRQLRTLGADLNAGGSPSSEAYRDFAMASVLSIAVLHWDNDSDVEYLLENGANPNWQPASTSNSTALQAAAQRGKPARVQLLLKYGAELNPIPVPKDGIRCFSPLRGAISGGHINMAMFLLGLGVDVRAESPATMCDLLEQAILQGRTDIVLLLLDSGADVNACHPFECRGHRILSGPTAMQAAAAMGNIELTKLLLAAGADVNACPGKYRHKVLSLQTPLFMTAVQAAALSGSSEVVEHLLNAKADIDIAAIKLTGRDDDPDVFELDTFRFAAESGNVDVAALITNAKTGREFDWEKLSPELTEALEAAVGFRHLAVAQFLLEMGAEVDGVESTSWTSPLQKASSLNPPERQLVQLLIDFGADVNHLPQRASGRTALQAAAQCDEDIVRLLLEKGADINAIPAEYAGLTALQAAVQWGHFDIALLLIEQGADVNAAGAKYVGSTALEAAAKEGYIDLVRMLLTKGASIKSSKALDLARKMGWVGIVSLLENTHQ